MRQFALLFLIIFSSIVAANEQEIINAQENFPVTSAPYEIIPKVNVITGDYIESEMDLVIAGCEPISIRRFYNHLATHDTRYGCWRYNPEQYAFANFGCDKMPFFMAVGDAEGGVTSYDRVNPSEYGFSMEKQPGLTNRALTGQTHPLNTKITVGTVLDPKNNKRSEFRGTIYDGNGLKRTFSTVMHDWHRCAYADKKTTFVKQPGYYVFAPSVWTPYHVPITEERKPNGNILVYGYEKFNEDKIYPSPQILKSIKVYDSAKKKELGSVTFDYVKEEKQVKRIDISGSDGRKVRLSHTERVLSRVRATGAPPLSYVSEGRRLKSVVRPDGNVFLTDYDPTSGKVAQQWAPVGTEDKLEIVGRYNYLPNATEVFDAEGHKKIYRYDDQKRLTAIESYDDEALYCTEKNEWNEATGDLNVKTIEDATSEVVYKINYGYDKNHNPITECMGDGHESILITRTFSDDGFNLKLSETDELGKTTRWSYRPQTNLLTSELTYDHDRICSRVFYFYDDCAVCIKKIVDDGDAQDPDDLTHVTTRKITITKPKESLPCYGLPEYIEEKTIDENGEEILLSKVTFKYAPSGQILTEEHYDANNNLAYTIVNEYEDEKLISTKDALGYTTTYTYDNNHRVTSLSGPDPGTHRRWIYDKIGRPTCQEEIEMNGDVIKNLKRYDKLSHVVGSTDECGFETTYAFDAMGRQATVTTPDGYTQTKEYDALGNVIKEIDAKGYETRRRCDYRGLPIEIYYPDGTEEHFKYNCRGALIERRDKNGAKTLYTRDIFDHAIETKVYSRTGALLKTSSASYTPFHVLTTTDGEGIKTTYSYDFAGRKIAQQRGDHTIFIFYDAMGRAFKTQEDDLFTIQKFDHLNRCTEIRKEDASGKLLEKTDYSYNARGNRTETITSKGTEKREYNNRGELIKITDAAGYVTRFTQSLKGGLQKTEISAKGVETLLKYDSCKRLIEQSKKKGLETLQKAEMRYDANGNQIEITHTIFAKNRPDKRITHTSIFGPMNRLEEHTEAGEKTTLYSYDGHGRLQTKTKPDSTTLNHGYDDLGRLSHYFSTDFDYHYEYDDNDRLRSVTDRKTNTTTTRSYDDHDNVVEEKLANELILKSEYENTKRKRVTLPDESHIDYAYQTRRLHKITRRGLTHEYSEWDLEGAITKTLLAAHMGAINISRDALGRWKECQSACFTALFPEDAYDGHGNLCHYEYIDAEGPMDCHYSYDTLDQCINEKEHSYLFDSLYNRIKKDEFDYVVNDLSQTTSDGLRDYKYDLNGNLTFDGETRYTYDTQDRLIETSKAQATVKYTYDPFHRRLSKNDARYIWDGNNEIGMTNKWGKIEELRVLGHGYGAEIGSAVLMELKDKTYIPIHDHRGCVVTLIDVSTKQPETYRYTAFGEELTQGKISPWRFASKRVDMETGLIFFGRRYYNAELGQWMTPDPQGFVDGPNLYAYLHNDPLNDFDLYGLYSDKLKSLTFGAFGMAGHLLDLWDLGKSSTNFERYFDNKSMNGDLNRSNLKMGGVGFTNGMWNRSGGARESPSHISSMMGNHNVFYTYNASHGPYDMLEAGMNLWGKATDPVAKIHERWDHFFANSKAGVPYLEFSHSQGTALVKQALLRYPPELRNRIISVALAPSAYIPKELCGRSIHYVSDHDFVPLIDQRGRAHCKDYTVTLKRSPGAPLFDHPFCSETYEESIGLELDKYFDILKNYEN